MKIQILFYMIFSFWAGRLLSTETAGLDAIYGPDDRIESSDIRDKKIKSIIAAVGMVISKEQIEKGFLYSTVPAVPMQENINVCKEEKFSQQLTLNACTAFLIASDLMISAGHCFEAEHCADKAVIFDVSSESQRMNSYRVANRNIYECKEVIAHSTTDSDFALIRLTRKTNRKPLTLRNRGELKATDEVFMLGYPLGSPLKLSQKVLPSDLRNSALFKAPLDSFTGNSGSPVINAHTLKVEGILVNGAEDFLLDEMNQCYRFMKHNSSPDEAPIGEGITRINQVLPFLPQ